jgi:hypothetical protein
MPAHISAESAGWESTSGSNTPIRRAKKIQRPDTQDAPQVKEAQVESSAQFLFAEPEFGNQVSAEQEEKVYSEPTGRSRARNQPAVADAARRKMGSVAAPARVKNENGKESNETKAIQFRR